MDAVKGCHNCKNQYLPASQEPCGTCWPANAAASTRAKWEPSIDFVEKKAEELVAKALTSTPSALDVQVGGDHYKSQGIQPIEYIFANSLGFCEGNVVKYVTRYGQKNGVQDLKKARHYLDMLIERLDKTNG